MPPATLYHWGDKDSGFYAEFLTPLTGSEYTRSGKRKATAQVAGVNSQQLRLIELLLNNAWTVELRAPDFELPVPKVVRVANPVGYLAQKILIRDRRSSEDQAKDILCSRHTAGVRCTPGRTAKRMDRTVSSRPAQQGCQDSRNRKPLAFRGGERYHPRGGVNAYRQKFDSGSYARKLPVWTSADREMTGIRHSSVLSSPGAVRRQD
ncbi:MAG: hypothetical protein IT162_05895 [Bryobacterales bacterium]|nr:hypothetical protein [Bryobacterales bacterium]